MCLYIHATVIMLTGNLVLLFYPVAQMVVHHLVNMKSGFHCI